MPEVTTKTDLKYTLKRRIASLSGSYRANKYLICAKVDVCLRTLESWMEIKKDESKSIPSDQLFELADFLSCNPSDLLNK